MNLYIVVLSTMISLSTFTDSPFSTKRKENRHVADKYCYPCMMQEDVEQELFELWEELPTSFGVDPLVSISVTSAVSRPVSSDSIIVL